MRYRLNGFGQFCVVIMLLVALVLAVCGCSSNSPVVHKTNFAWGELCPKETHQDCTTDTDGNVSCSCVPN